MEMMTAVECLLYIIDDTSKRGQPPLQTCVPDPAFHPQMSGEACGGNSVEVRSWQGSPHSSHHTLLHTTQCLLTHPWHPHHRGFSLLVENMHDGEHLTSPMWNKLIQITTSQHRQGINLLHQSSAKRIKLENQSLSRHLLLSTSVQTPRASSAFGYAPPHSSWGHVQPASLKFSSNFQLWHCLRSTRSRTCNSQGCPLIPSRKGKQGVSMALWRALVSKSHCRDVTQKM